MDFDVQGDLQLDMVNYLGQSADSLDKFMAGATDVLVSVVAIAMSLMLLNLNLISVSSR